MKKVFSFNFGFAIATTQRVCTLWRKRETGNAEVLVNGRTMAAVVVLVAATLQVTALNSHAQVGFTNLHSFGEFENGAYAEGLAQGNDGSFYGTTSGGGAYGQGTVFKITPGAAITTLYSFTGSNDGGSPAGPLALGNDGNFYGTTTSGGSNGVGTVFRISTMGALTTLYCFTNDDSGAGPVPNGGLVQGNDGSFYGTTEAGGNGYGSVFKISLNGTFANLYFFHGYGDGLYPTAGLVQGSDGYFYGTTQGTAYGGYSGSGFGSVFKISSSGELTNLYFFHGGGGNDGAQPDGRLVQGADGYFYGTTEYGSSTGRGTVFKINAGGNYAELYFFTDGGGPAGGLVQASDGYLYGTAIAGGTNEYGSIFSISTNGAFATLYSFSGGDGGDFPNAGLVCDSDGNFYGTTPGGMAIWDDYGTVFKFSASGAFSTLYSFNREADGESPSTRLVQSSDGYFYGTTESGGADGYGVVYKISSNGAFTNLYSFSGGIADGSDPSSLIQGSDGNFYGTCANGGWGGGTVFGISGAGAFTNLYSFYGENDGGSPAGLVQGSDGNFYGTTQYGGTSRYGTVFEVGNSSPFTSLYSFGGGSDGVYPVGTLIQGSDGNFYGVTHGGYVASTWHGYGTVFKFSLANGLTTLYSFTGFNDGGYPNGGLVQGSDGNFYGTTAGAGAQPWGTVFRMSPGGTLTTLYSFNDTNGGVYPSILSQAGDGDFYGATQDGGTNGVGMIFKIGTNGVLTYLYSFVGGVNGYYPNAPPVQGEDGNLDGTTENGGAGSVGMVYQLSVGLPTLEFSANPTNGAAPLGVQFDSAGFDSLGNTIVNWSWNFGDGSMTNGQIPSHTYANNGAFIPSLIATNNHGVAVIGYGPQIVVTPGPPAITLQSPASLTASVGSSVTLAVSVAGVGPFSYQWQQNGTNLPNNIIITTVAGNEMPGYSGDGGAAIAAELNYPAGVAVDAAGDVFTADSGYNVIRKVGTNGIISTVAGSGVAGYSGDGMSATNAELNSPDGVAVDAAGHLFIADSGNNVIREVETNGTISTVAGNGIGGYAGDGMSATNAELDGPQEVAVDGYGQLFVADENNNVIRKVGTSGIITTVAGSGTNYFGNGEEATNAGLYLPDGVTVDARGNLFIADSGNNVVRKVGTNGIIMIVAGDGGYGYSGDGGAATNAELWGPYGVAVDATGNVFIADNNNNVIRKVETNGIITTVAGNGMPGYSGDGGAPTNAELAYPSGLALDTAGNLFIADSSNNRIRKVETNGIITTVAGNGVGDGGAATNAQLNFPQGVAVDTAGNLFISDSDDSRVRKVETNGIITTVAGSGVEGYWGDGGAATNAQLALPDGVAVDVNGNLFISDFLDNVIRKVWTNGTITTLAGDGTMGYSGDGGAATNAELAYPCGVAVDALGDLFIADGDIREVETNGIINTVAGDPFAEGDYSGDGGMATNAGLDNPQDVVVDATGNLFIADTLNNVIREVGTNGIITTAAGNGYDAGTGGYGGGYAGDGGAATNAELFNPAGVAVDAVGNLFIADSSNNRIRQVGADGIITTVAGNGTNGYSGDGGAATTAELNYPEGVAEDGNGDLYIADSKNNLIRKLVLNTSVLSPTLVLSNVGAGNAGAYDVVVSSPYGSATSSVVSLTITVSPLVILSAPHATVANTNFTFLLSGPAGSNYVLQVSTNLVNWNSISTSSIPVGGSITLSNSVNGYNRRFYRAYLQ